MLIKKILRKIIPKRIRVFFWQAVPRFSFVNTYVLNNPKYFNNLSPISNSFTIREINFNDKERLERAYGSRGSSFIRRKVPSRQESNEWIGLAVFDKENGEIAYIAWIIDRSIRYFKEYGIHLSQGQFLLKDGYCVLNYRHLGLHTRMEHERINYCIRNGANQIFIQIHNSNNKGIASVEGNGYVLFKQNLVIQWQLFDIYRPLIAFLKNPFKKVIK